VLKTALATDEKAVDKCPERDAGTWPRLPVTPEDSAFRTFMLFMQVGSATSKHADSRFYRVKRLSMAKYLALMALTVNGGTLIHSELAVWTNTKRHNITTLVERMQKDGLVITRRRTHDKRFVEVTLTEAGRAAFESAGPVARSIVYRMMSGIGEDEAAVLERCLQTMGKNIR
jgi:DNA-binding MarR family transcriptional regulator